MTSLQLTKPTADKLLATDYNEGLVHQVVTAYFAGSRAGTKAQKTRSMVSGGGAKPWRQKGTGRARAGTIRSPIWRGGGVTFAAKNRDFSQKVNKRMYRKAMASIIAELNRNDCLQVVKDIELKEPKTRVLADLLKKAELSDVLIVIHEVNANLLMASNNIPNVNVIMQEDVNPVFLLAHQRVIVTEQALKALEEKYS